MNATQNQTIHQYFDVLKKRRKVFLVVMAAVFCAVLSVTFFSTPQFMATSQIIIERVEPNNLSGTNRSLPRDPEFEKTQFELLRSSAVSSRVVKILKLEENFDTMQSPAQPSVFMVVKSSVEEWVDDLVSLFNLSPSTDETVAEDEPSRNRQIANQLAENLRVKPVQGSNITAVSYQSPNPGFAALVANTYIQAYLEEVLDMKMDATRRNLEWMTAKAEGERLKLQAAEKKLQEYTENNDLVTLENRVTILPETLSQLSRDLIRAESKTKEHQLLYSKVKSVSNNLDAAESVLSISEGSSLDVLRAQILKAEQNIMELSSKYGTKHPTMIKAKGDLEILKKKRRQEISRVTEKIKGQYELALSNENSIRAQLNKTKGETLGLNEKYAQYTILKREIDTNRQLYDALMTKIKDQSITGETRPVNIWVVDSAKVPAKPYRPVVPVNLALGLFLGLTCGIGSTFLFNYLDNRVKSTDSLGDALGVAVLGSVTFNRNAKSMSQIALTEPRSEFSESYNALRTTLLLSSAEAPPKRILVTSSIAGEGKTTTSINLALAMAKSGSRVVLIDMDMRKPVIHKIFKLHNSTGLSSYLAGSDGKSIVKKTSLDNLAVIPAGPTPPNPYELLNSKRMQGLLQGLDNEFDYIICDSPPILSVADSRLLSREVSGLILVVRAGKTTYPMAQNSIQLLRDVNAKILGVLLNAVLAKDQSYYQYYSSYIDDAAKPQVTT